MLMFEKRRQKPNDAGTRYLLVAYYDGPQDEDWESFGPELLRLDTVAVEAVGFQVSRSLTDLETNSRELEFHFPTEQEMEDAKERLSEAGFRFVR
jgi:hypothetical protein